MEKKIIEEVIIKKNKDKINKEKLSEKVKSELLNKKKKRQQSEQYLSAQKIVKNYREKQKSHAGFKRNLQQTKRKDVTYDKTREGSPIIIIRICGLWERITDEIKTMLVKLRLKRLYSAIVLRYDKETVKMISLIEPYITWGYLKKSRLSELLHKRGTIRNENGDVNELDNQTIENHLGKYNILCMEDIIYELTNGGQHFNEIMNFLGFFLLSKTDEIVDKVNIPFHKGGAQGFRGDKIDEILQNMI